MGEAGVEYMTYKEISMRAFHCTTNSLSSILFLLNITFAGNHEDDDERARMRVRYACGEINYAPKGGVRQKGVGHVNDKAVTTM
jgi:hypothetical protein